MHEYPDARIPVLTDVVAATGDAPDRRPSEVETLVAELQTRLAADTFSLTEEILRTSFAEMEAGLYEQISARLREALPELIDSVLREHLDTDADAKDQRDRQ
ncbi:MAG: hypothetical protein JXB36_05545 [Gammaproteobacteria bacterium]|nr:hypothetical protein [Gammaproteobacteria bacterium]